MSRCFQCKFGYVVRRNGTRCQRKGKHARGCRHETRNAECQSCRLGFYQNYLNSNRRGCQPDPMYFCDEFLNADKSQCKCREGALQMSYENDHCKLMARNDSDKFWKQMAHKNRLIYNDTCYKKKSLELFMCSYVKMAPAVGGTVIEYEGLHAAIKHYLSEPTYQEQLELVTSKRRKTQAKKMLTDMVKHMRGYKDIGIDVVCEDGHMTPGLRVTEATQVVDPVPVQPTPQ